MSEILIFKENNKTNKKQERQNNCKKMARLLKFVENPSELIHSVRV
jgi:hypothetical protein